MRSFYNLKAKKGFTLIEAVIVMTLVSVLALGIGSFILTAMQAWSLVSQRSSQVNVGRVAMNRMTAEIRRIKALTLLTTYTVTRCAFTDMNNNPIDYQQSGTSLMRNSDILASGLASPGGLQFTYLNNMGLTASGTPEMYSIRIKISLVSGTQRMTLESSARIRNR